MIQLLRFPAAKHDDGVDVLSLFGRGLQIIKAPKAKRKFEQPEQNYLPTGWMA